MIKLEELRTRINKILKTFKRKTKCIACLILDIDGFILFIQSEHQYQSIRFKKYFLRLFNKIENLNTSNSELIDYTTQREVISLCTVEEYLSRGFMIIFQSLSKDLIFFTLFPYLLNTKPIYNEFDIVYRKLSQYFDEAKDDIALNSLYKLI